MRSDDGRPATPWSGAMVTCTMRPIRAAAASGPRMKWTLKMRATAACPAAAPGVHAHDGVGAVSTKASANTGSVVGVATASAESKTTMCWAARLARAPACTSTCSSASGP